MTVYTDNGREATITKLERRTIKNELLLTTVKDKRTGQEVEVEDYFVFQAKCVRKFGLAAGVYVRQLVFWDGLGRDPDGWVYKSEDEMESETGMQRRGQREARKILTSCEVLEEKRKGLPCRLFYRVNLEKLAEVLESPGSTLNQWKRGATKDPETGKYQRPEETTLNPSYRQDGITDPTSEDAITDLSSRDGITDRPSEDGSSVPARQDGTRDLSSEDGNTVPAITENTHRENNGENTESTSEVFPESSVFQTGANGPSDRPTPPPTNKNISKDFSKDEGQEQAQPAPTTSLPLRPEVESKLLSEIGRVLKNGKHAPVALKHYRAGSVDAQEVAETVSWELSGKLDASPALVQAVRRVLNEDVSKTRAV